MTYHRQGRRYRVATIFDTAHGVYVLYYGKIDELAGVEINEVILEHRFETILAAQIYLKDRIGVPLGVWVSLDGILEMPYEPEKFFHWSCVTVEMLMILFYGNHAKAARVYAQGLGTSPAGLMLFGATIRHRYIRQFPLVYADWLLREEVKDALNYGDWSRARRCYKRLTSLELHKITRRLEKLYDVTAPKTENT